MTILFRQEDARWTVVKCDGDLSFVRNKDTRDTSRHQQVKLEQRSYHDLIVKWNAHILLLRHLNLSIWFRFFFTFFLTTNSRLQTLS